MERKRIVPKKAVPQAFIADNVSVPEDRAAKRSQPLTHSPFAKIGNSQVSSPGRERLVFRNKSMTGYSIFMAALAIAARPDSIEFSDSKDAPVYKQEARPVEKEIASYTALAFDTFLAANTINTIISGVESSFFNKKFNSFVFDLVAEDEEIRSLAKSRFSSAMFTIVVGMFNEYANSVESVERCSYTNCYLSSGSIVKLIEMQGRRWHTKEKATSLPIQLATAIEFIRGIFVDICEFVVADFLANATEVYITNTEDSVMWAYLKDNLRPALHSNFEFCTFFVRDFGADVVDVFAAKNKKLPSLVLQLSKQSNGHDFAKVSRSNLEEIISLSSIYYKA